MPACGGVPACPASIVRAFLIKSRRSGWERHVTLGGATLLAGDEIMRLAKQRVRYRVSAPLTAVKLEDHPGSSLRDPTGPLVKIPADVIVEQEGAVGRSALINVLWNGEVFSVFYDDLEEKAEVLSASGK